MLAGCGGSSTQTFSGNTQVTVVSSSAANDELTQLNLGIKSLVLTDGSGKTVTLLQAPEHAELMHVNGLAEPLFAASLPQGTYISATATVGPADFVCESGNAGDTETTAEYAYDSTPNSQVTVKLPTPLTTSGPNMTLALNLLVSQSASWVSTSCTNSQNTSFMITPTFTLEPAVSASQAEFQNLEGVVDSVNASGNSLIVKAGDGSVKATNSDGSSEIYVGPSWSVIPTASTTFQGIAGLSAITAGMPVEISATLQADGSLEASRIAVPDSNPINLTIFSGPLLILRSDNPVVYIEQIEENGYQSAHGGNVTGAAGFDYQNAKFQISGAIPDVQQLPFSAQFGPGSMADGQVVSITTHQTAPPDVNLGLTATTLTLEPQTINGTVTAIGSEAGFTTYTVSLADYDLFPQLAVQRFQNTVLTSPGTVTVYADSSVQMANTQPVAVGSVVRFNGVVFNDQGTLRMDCLRIADGVAE